MKRKAFTLIEMLVVLAIIGMFMGISVPFASGFGKGLRLKTAARAVSGVLRVARSNAVTLRRNHSVVFDAEENKYWIEDGAGKIYEKKYSLSSSVKFDITGADREITFLPDGAIDGQTRAITLTDKQGGSRTILISRTTGNITLE
ncbi:MAG: GspH/FimT family pseudopilin [Candidatus Omnitrophota bacterium]